MFWVVVFVLFLYAIWDVNYFIRCIFTVVLGRLFQKKKQINEKTTIYGKFFEQY